MLLTDVETEVRQDLFDPVGSNQRWQTSDLDRAIDKAVDRYSQYYPKTVSDETGSINLEEKIDELFPSHLQFPNLLVRRAFPSVFKIYDVEPKVLPTEMLYRDWRTQKRDAPGTIYQIDEEESATFIDWDNARPELKAMISPYMKEDTNDI